MSLNKLENEREEHRLWYQTTYLQDEATLKAKLIQAQLNGNDDHQILRGSHRNSTYSERSDNDTYGIKKKQNDQLIRENDKLESELRNNLKKDIDMQNTKATYQEDITKKKLIIDKHVLEIRNLYNRINIK